MNAAFEPLGEVARWRMIVAAFHDAEHGTVITYAQLGEVLGLDPGSPRDLGAIQGAVRSAQVAMSRDHSKSLAAVTGIGYRIVQPNEHVDLAGKQQRRSRGALVRARRHVDHVNLSALSEDGRNRAHAASSILAWQHQQIRRLDLQQRNLTQVVGAVVTHVERSDEENAERFERLEKRLAELDGSTE